MSNKLSYSLLLAVLIFFLFPLTASAQVVINEVYNTAYGDAGDWVELYSSTDTDISNWVVKDEAGNDEIIPALTNIGPGSSKYYVVPMGRWLNKYGDTIFLYKADETSSEDPVKYGTSGGVCTPEEGIHSIGRSPDGTGSFVRFVSRTEGAINNSAQDPCPTSTPTPPTPTDTPSTPDPTDEPTSAPTSTPTSTPKSTVKARATRRPVSEKDDEDHEDLVIGLRDELSTPEATEEAEGNGKVPWGSILLIIVGLGFIGLAGYAFYTQKEKGQTDEKPGEKVE